MRIIAQMMIRNEADVIYECLTEIVKWGIKEIVVLDGASTDGTTDIVASFLDADVDIQSSPDPKGRFADHRRNELLRMTRRHNPDWIISVDADEIYDTNPIQAIKVADGLGCNVVRCMVPQFWITIADVRAGLVTEDTRSPVQERRRWYSWGHMGTFIWKDHPDHFYPQDVQKRTPEMPHQDWREWQRAPGMMPICKHYCFRSLEQAVERARARRERGGRKYFGKYFYNWLIDEELCGLAYKVDGEGWDTRYTHQAVHDYMALRREVINGRVVVPMGEVA